MKFFTEPAIEIEKFEMLDVIATSGDDSIVTEPVWGGGDQDMWA